MVTETRLVFFPAHIMPMYSQKKALYKVAENLGRRGVNLPSWPGLSKIQIDLICKEISDFFA